MAAPDRDLAQRVYIRPSEVEAIYAIKASYLRSNHRGPSRFKRITARVPSDPDELRAALQGAAESFHGIDKQRLAEMTANDVRTTATLLDAAAKLIAPTAQGTPRAPHEDQRSAIARSGATPQRRTTRSR